MAALVARRTAVVLLAAALCAIYLPDIGHGFVRDDFGWIRAGRVSAFTDLPQLLVANLGFYRPLVLLTFSADYALFGMHAFPYALTNLAMLAVCAVLLHRLARRLGLSPLAALTVAAVWCFNPRAVGMSLLWISGRTALLLSLFALLASLATLQQRWWRGALWCLLALFSKEEAVTLPFLLAGWTWWTATDDSQQRNVVRRCWPLFVVIPIYLVLRWYSPAFWPINSPSYYRFTFAPLALLRNGLEYLDRSFTFAIGVALVVMAAARVVPRFDPRERRVLAFASAWFVAGLAITLFLPLRSDLYALTPSIGAALVSGIIVDACSRRQPRRVVTTLTALTVLPFLLLPIYRSRNVRWVMPADLSTRVLANPAGATTMDPADIESAFGSLLPDAMVLIGK